MQQEEQGKGWNSFSFTESQLTPVIERINELCVLTDADICHPAYCGVKYSKL